MKKVISLILVSTMLLVACSNSYESSNSNSSEDTIVSEASTQESIIDNIPSETTAIITESTQASETITIDYEQSVDPNSFTSLADPALHEYIEDNIYATLDAELASVSVKPCALRK